MLRVRIHVIFMNEVDKGYKHFIVYLYFLLCIIDITSRHLHFLFKLQKVSIPSIKRILVYKLQTIHYKLSVVEDCRLGNKDKNVQYSACRDEIQFVYSNVV